MTKTMCDIARRYWRFGLRRVFADPFAPQQEAHPTAIQGGWVFGSSGPRKGTKTKTKTGMGILGALTAEGMEQ
jgi:hypothetical protein